MKIEAHILSVRDRGDTLAVEAQGRIGKAEWAAWKSFTVEVPKTSATVKAYYVGRLLDIEISPKGAPK